MRPETPGRTPLSPRPLAPPIGRACSSRTVRRDPVVVVAHTGGDVPPSPIASGAGGPIRDRPGDMAQQTATVAGPLGTARDGVGLGRPPIRTAEVRRDELLGLH